RLQDLYLSMNLPHLMMPPFCYVWKPANNFDIIETRLVAKQQKMQLESIPVEYLETAESDSERKKQELLALYQKPKQTKHCYLETHRNHSFLHNNSAKQLL